MGFLDGIIRDWDGKTATPELRFRLEAAAKNWVSQKSSLVNAALAKGEIGLAEASSQIDHLHTVAYSKVQHALRSRPNDPARKAGSSGRQPVDIPEESQ